MPKPDSTSPTRPVQQQGDRHHYSVVAFAADIERWRFAVDPIARKLGLPVDLVLAVIQVESGGNPDAARMEPPYSYFWDVKHGKPFRRPTAAENSRDRAPSDFPSFPGCSRHTEWNFQQTSFGLMQVIGAVARERGLKSPFLTILCDPCTGIDYGCHHLAWIGHRHLAKYGWAGVLRFYNGGGYAMRNNTNPEYPQKVLAILGGEWPQP